MNKGILAIIPARGGSKGIPGKNMADLCGRPLIQYTIDAAKAASSVSRIILSSDDDRIMDYGRQQGIEVPFKRPAPLAGDDVPMIDVVCHTLDFLKSKDNYQPSIVVVLQPTSPLRTAEDIDQTVFSLCGDEQAASVVSVVEVPHQYTPASVMRLENGVLVPFMPLEERKNLRQNKPCFYGRNGPAVLAVRTEVVITKRSFYDGKVLAHVMPPERSIDIDNPPDLKLASFYLQGRGQ